MIDNPIPWPHGARCAVAITWDLDADSGLNYYHPDRADRLVASQSLTRYGPTLQKGWCWHGLFSEEMSRKWE